MSSAPKQVFKAGLSSSYDGWAKCKEIVPDVLDPNQNVQITCNSKVYITEKFIHQKGAEKLGKDELYVFSYTS